MGRHRTSVRAGLAAAVVLASLGACSRRRSRPESAPPTTTGRPAAGITPRAEPSREALALSTAFASAAKAISASVVRVDVEGIPDDAPGEAPDLPDFLRRFFEERKGTSESHLPDSVRGTGSGVILDGAGHVLTNGHVVRGARRVTLGMADQRKFSAHVVGIDPLTDVGILAFDKPPPGLVAARIGDSERLRIGEWAIAVGSPLGMDQTVTVGIISGIGATGHRFRFESGERVRRYIQTDAKINPGNSGGPLVNLVGEVVGINTLINVGPGGSYGFAIPVSQAAQVAQALIKDGHVRYPYIGVSVTTLSEISPNAPERAGAKLPSDGALVGAVNAGGPAAVAGLEAGDVITKAAGRAIKNAGDLVATISEQKIGARVPIEFAHGDHARSGTIVVKEYPSEPLPAAEKGEARLGLALQTLTGPMASSLGLDPKITGAIVTEVIPGSLAEQAGLAAGEVIREVDKRPVNTADEAVAALRAGQGTRLLRITNAAGSRYVSVGPG
jgi:serine protease Do